MYMVRSRSRSTEDANKVIFHEFVGHFGLRGFLRDRLNPALDLIHVNNPLVRQYTNEWRKTTVISAEVRHIRPRLSLPAIEEAMARMAQENKPYYLCQAAFVHRAKPLLRQIGMTRLADTMEAKTNAEALTCCTRPVSTSAAAILSGEHPGTALPLFMTAWHGSPYTSTSSARTRSGQYGEGAQAYGMGLLCGKKEVAEYYKNALARRMLIYNGVKIPHR
jgi:hypothetical protein